MKKSIFYLLIIFSFLQSESYSWEDGGTILGSYGNVSNPTNSGSLNGVNPYDGDYMLSVSESPLDGTPKAYLAYIQNLNPGDVVTASFYTYDNAAGSPSAAPTSRAGTRPWPTSRRSLAPHRGPAAAAGSSP